LQDVSSQFSIFLECACRQIDLIRLVLPIGRGGTPQNVAVLLQHRSKHLNFSVDGKESFRKIRRVVSDAIRDVRRCADLREVSM
jgi:hypothetical protein